MLIANPIYDAVFKYLLEDLDIARELIGLIIGEEILQLDVRPQETTSKELFMEGIRLFRLDFKAVIKVKDKKPKKVLIELQKAKDIFDIKRFRRYLGENYIKGDVVNEDTVDYKALPIITIYFLGFQLQHVPYPVLKVGRKFVDVLSGENIEKPLDKDDFLSLLTHECYTVQIPRLKMDVKTKLEKVLSVFKMERTELSPRALIADEKNTENNLLFEKIVNRLGRAMLSEEMLRKMEAEDEIESIFGENLEKLKNTTVKLEKAEKKLETTKTKLATTKSSLKTAEKQKQEAEKQKQEAEKQKQEAEKQKQEAEKQKQEAEKQKQEAEKQKQEAEKQKMKIEKQKEQVEKQKEQVEKEKALLEKQKEESEQQKELLEKQKQEAEKQKEEALKELEQLKKLLNK